MSDWEQWLGRSSTSSATLDPEQANHMAVTLDRVPSFRAGDALPPAWHWRSARTSAASPSSSTSLECRIC